MRNSAYILATLPAAIGILVLVHLVRTAFYWVLWLWLGWLNCISGPDEFNHAWAICLALSLVMPTNTSSNK